MRTKKLVLFYLTIIFVSYISGCSEEGVFDKEPELSDYPYPKEYDFTALDFPSANGSSWTYIEPESGIEQTLKIEGVRDINGITCRRLKHQLVGTPTNFLSANSFYLKADGEYTFRPYPVSATYFQKDLEYYTEYSFEICLPGPDDSCIDPKDGEENSTQHETFKQEHYPPRILWKFPIQVGNKWTVFKKPTPETVTVVRNVADVVSVKVPSGSYPNAYLVEERLYFGQPVERKPDALYWVVPNVGVVKYQYYVFTTQEPTVRTFELKEVKLIK